MNLNLKKILGSIFVQIIADNIPFNNPTLTAAVYEKILNEFLNAGNYTVSIKLDS